ncbi:MAG: hypothetical protein GXY77_02520 [Fibrobacter sp.]|nr:hypothetical protein [Fibrobacter sp.]
MKFQSVLINTYDLQAQDRKINSMYESGFEHYESVCIPGSSEIILRFRAIEED